jgi:hypothetical protein
MPNTTIGSPSSLIAEAGPLQPDQSIPCKWRRFANTDQGRFGQANLEGHQQRVRGTVEDESQDAGVTDFRNPARAAEAVT